MTRYLKALLRSGPARQALTARFWVEMPQMQGLRLTEDNGLVAVPVEAVRRAGKLRLDDPERV